MDCPSCGEPDMIFYPGGTDPDDDYPEPDVYGCPDCGYEEVA